MHKTLHKKLTDKHVYGYEHTLTYPSREEMLTGLAQEMFLLREAAKDLLQPRPEAVAGILKVARTI